MLRTIYLLMFTLFVMACVEAEPGSRRRRTDTQDADAGSCVGVGGSCSTTECCPGATCIEDGEQVVCARNCEADSQCDTGCCAELSDGSGAVCSPEWYCEYDEDRCPHLILLGDDATFLGEASSDPDLVDGICNPNSPYASQDSEDSIFNPAGTYGSVDSLLSAYHATTSTPPSLYCETTEAYYNWVTKNDRLAEAIDPDEICPFLEENGY